MVRCNIIPRNLAGVEHPVWPGCAYGKAYTKPWSYKDINNLRKILHTTSPGAIVNVDQLVSPAPGFVPTHRGLSTKKRYLGDTLFVDHYSDLTYTYLMTDMDGDKTAQAKLVFEMLILTILK